MVSDIHVQHFRSYEDASFEFGEGVNIIVGPNGSGKTNLLEAILVLARGGSYRVSDADLLRFGADWARLDAHTGNGGERTVKLQNQGTVKKTYQLDGKAYTRLPQQKHLPVVLFEPNHLFVLQGPPEGRRNYLDDILEQTTPGYTSFRKNYRRVLAQRNALLKHPNTKNQDFFPWNLRLSELGAVIHRTRRAFIDELNEAITGLYHELAGEKTSLTLTYSSHLAPVEYETKLLRALEDNFDKDIARGFTTYGPHREDMQVLFDGNPAELVASRGEIRSATLALKILELQKLQTTTNQTPLLLLDDVFSELDGARRRALTAHLQAYQTFLTTTDADIVVKHFTTSTIIPLG